MKKKLAVTKPIKETLLDVNHSTSLVAVKLLM